MPFLKSCNTVNNYDNLVYCRGECAHQFDAKIIKNESQRIKLCGVEV